MFLRTLKLIPSPAVSDPVEEMNRATVSETRGTEKSQRPEEGIVVGIFRGPLFRGPLVISSHVLI